MAIGDLANRYRAEHHDRYDEFQWYQTTARLPAFLFDRLDALAAEVHESRNRVMVRLLDEATAELAGRMADGDKELVRRLLPDLDTESVDRSGTAG